MQWALDGAAERDILAAIAVNYPTANAGDLIAAVVADLEKSAAAAPEVVIGWCFEATRELYRRMVEIGDFPGALRAVKQMKELTGNVRSGTEADGNDEESAAEAGAPGELPAAQGEGGPAPA